MDRAGSIRADEFFKLVPDRSKIRACLVPADVILLPDQAHGFVFRSPFQDGIGHQGRGRVEVQDTIGIDDQSAVAVRVEPQMDAAFLIRIFPAVMINAGVGVLDLEFRIEPLSDKIHSAPVKSDQNFSI